MKKNILTIDNLSLKYEDMELKIINNLNISISQGEFVVLLGSNGCGKSSLLKIINRKIIPTNGYITFMQKNIHNIPKKELVKDMIYLTQNLNESLFFDFTVLENIILWQARYNNNIKNINLDMFNSNLNKKLSTQVSLLSGGEKQALLLALCLNYPPKLLLLDEHTSALDPNTSDNIMTLTNQSIKDKNITCLMSTHNLDYAIKYGTRLLLINNGKIILDLSGKEKTTITKEDLFEIYN